MNQVLGTRRRIGQMFELTSLHLPSPTAPLPSYVAIVASISSLNPCHLRLSHVLLQKICDLISSGYLGQVKNDLVECESCQLAKQHVLSIVGGYRYLVLFVDDYSHFTWIYLMHARSELPQIYHTFAHMISTQFFNLLRSPALIMQWNIKDSTLLDKIHSQDIIVQHSSPTTSQQNGRAERKNRHKPDSVQALLLSANSLELLCREAALTVVHTINHLPSSVLQNQPLF